MAIEPLLSCPMPHPAGDRILLAHGEGARLSRRLIREVLLDAFDNEFLRPLADSAVLPCFEGQPVMTTDSYVVSPLFFPGGDIGTLAVHGTINDLAVCGAKPLYLSLGLIIEEGLPLEILRQVARSIGTAARDCGIPIVTGDTKVVPVGAADKLFVNMAGIGRLRPGIELGPARIRMGDCVLVSGDIGDHGIAVLSAREGFELGGSLRSDTAPLHNLVASLFESGIDMHFMRDPTRGGVSAVLHEIADAANVSIIIEEESLPLSEPVRGACEILGLDPLYVANEGKVIVVVAPTDVDRALTCMRQHSIGKNATQIGVVTASQQSPVLVRGPLGTLRMLDEPSGAPLPRIC